MNSKKDIELKSARQKTGIAGVLHFISDKTLKNKNGSYITEAAMSLPVLILCVVALALIIRIIAICENICFVTAGEIKDIDIAAYRIENTYGIGSIAIEESVREENPKLTSFAVTEFNYLYSENGIDELIGVRTQADFKVENPIGILGRISFTQDILTRGFTGKELDAQPLSAAEFMRADESSRVVVFPKYGERYHMQSCRYVQNYEGDEAYMLEMEKEDAKAKGYTPCTVCGGGES